MSEGSTGEQKTIESPEQKAPQQNEEILLSSLNLPGDTRADFIVEHLTKPETIALATNIIISEMALKRGTSSFDVMREMMDKHRKIISALRERFPDVLRYIGREILIAESRITWSGSVEKKYHDNKLVDLVRENFGLSDADVFPAMAGSFPRHFILGMYGYGERASVTSPHVMKDIEFLAQNRGEVTIEQLMEIIFNLTFDEIIACVNHKEGAKKIQRSIVKGMITVYQKIGGQRREIVGSSLAKEMGDLGKL